MTLEYRLSISDFLVFALSARAKGWALTTFLREAWGSTREEIVNTM